MDFSVSISALQGYSKKLESQQQSLASADTIAGRNFETLLLSSCDIQGKSSFSIPATTIRHLNEIGDPIATNVASNFSIVGSGWVMVADDSGQTGYTRDGTFAIDYTNKLRNTSGEYLQVYLTDKNGNTLSTVDPQSLNSLTTLDLSNVLPYYSTTKNVKIEGQLPLTQDPRYPNSGQQYPTNLTVFNSLGLQKNLDWIFSKSDVTPISADTSTVWSVGLTDPNKLTTSINGPYKVNSDLEAISGKVYVEFDSSGNLLGFWDGTQETLPTTLSSTPPNLKLAWEDGAEDSDIALNFGAVGKSNGLSSLGNEFRMNITADGSEPGVFSFFSFDEKGLGTVHYSNNQSISYCRIPLANFANANQLSENKPGFFGSTPQTGNPQISFPGYNGLGLLKTKSRESSSVDTTQTYLGMIQTQSNYVANLKPVEVIKECESRLMNV